MLTLEQVRKLEERVSAALGYIDRLSTENAALRQRLSGYEGRIKDLEVLVRDFQQDQSRIEEGILHALKKLDAFEDAVVSAADAKAGAALAGSAKDVPAGKPSPRGSTLIRSVDDGAAPAAASGSDADIEETEEILEEETLDPLETPERTGKNADSDPGELDIF